MDAQDNAEVQALANEYIKAQSEEVECGRRKATAKAKLLMLIGDASKVLCGNRITISAGTVGETVVERYTRKAYRNFRVNVGAQKQEKAA